VLLVLHRAGRHRTASIIALFILCAGLRVALLRRIPPPQPEVHDEFVYLLGADTFSSGRMTNPPHPLRRFFETTQVLSEPTYASKYPPGQALFLAVGQRIFGHPYFGVVLSVSLMIAALCWMLQAWVPPGWALIGALIALRTFHVNHYWMQSYWGGAVAALGAALAIGAYGRLTKGRWRAAWLGGLGVVVLLLTRPYEGGGLTVVLCVALAFWYLRQGPATRRAALRRAGIPLAVTIAAGFAFEAWYDWRVTGNPLTPPQLVHTLRYQAAPILWMLPPLGPKQYLYPEQEKIHAEAEMRPYRDIRSRGMVSRAIRLVERAVVSLPPPLRVVWAAWLLAFVFPDRRLREIAWCALGLFGVLLLETWMFGHYEAPFVPLTLLLLARVSWRMWHVQYRRMQVGHAVVTLFLLFTVAPWPSLTAGPRSTAPPLAAGSSESFPRDRAALVARLTAAGGRHVVLVRYGEAHNPHQEWIYNAANIDASPIVWAHDRGDDNARLLEYYRGRTFWLLEPDRAPDCLTPYITR
jgi:hypothetical protein